jgi:hypothetical protein
VLFGTRPSETDPDNVPWSWDPLDSLLKKNTKHSRRDERNEAEGTFLSKELSARPSIAAQNEVKKSSRGIPVLEEAAITCQMDY